MPATEIVHASGPHRYRCDAGHEINMPNCTWTTLVVGFGNEEPKPYNYCMHCFGIWAVAQWPLREIPAQS